MQYIYNTDGCYSINITPKIEHFGLDIEPITNENIKTAIHYWFSNNIYATKKYGHISDWDTSNVTNMSQLFEYNKSFNEGQKEE